MSLESAGAPNTAPDGAHNALQDAWFKILKPVLAPDQPAANAGSGTYQKVELDVDGQHREYEVYRSPHFDPTKQARVIMTLHGSAFGKDGASGLEARETGFDPAIDKRADAGNALVVYPIANNRTSTMLTGQTWNYANHRNIFDTWKNYDDGKYMDRVLADLKQHVKVGEVDGVGFGDGGRFLKQYSDEHPGLFSKIVLDNATTLGDTSTKPVPGVKTDYLIMEATRDPAKSSIWQRILHPFATNLMLPYSGGPGAMAEITPNLSGVDDSHPNMLKVEAASQTSCSNPKVFDTPKETDTVYQNCLGGSVTERLEKGAQFAWNDTQNGDGGHGIFWLVGARSNFGDTTAALDFILDGKLNFIKPGMSAEPAAQPEPPKQEAPKPQQPSVSAPVEAAAPAAKVPEAKPAAKVPEAKPPAEKQPAPLPFVGQKVTDLEPGINPRLGCAIAVSSALHAQDSRVATTDNVDRLKDELVKLGYKMSVFKPGELKESDLQTDDVIVGYREENIGRRHDHMPRHAAIYTGNGKVYQNDSNTGIIGQGDLQQFNVGLFDKAGHFDANGFERVIVLRRPASS